LCGEAQSRQQGVQGVEQQRGLQVRDVLAADHQRGATSRLAQQGPAADLGAQTRQRLVGEQAARQRAHPSPGAAALSDAGVQLQLLAGLAALEHRRAVQPGKRHRQPERQLHRQLAGQLQKARCAQHLAPQHPRRDPSLAPEPGDQAAQAGQVARQFDCPCQQQVGGEDRKRRRPLLGLSVQQGQRLQVGALAILLGDEHSRRGVKDPPDHGELHMFSGHVPIRSLVAPTGGDPARPAAGKAAALKQSRKGL
jgi:hypothetical protein